MTQKTKKTTNNKEKKIAVTKKRKLLNFSNEELPKSIDILSSKYESYEEELKESYKHEHLGKKWDSSGKEFICILLVEKYT